MAIKKDEKLDLDHLHWSIEGRAETQKTTLRLYELFDEYEEELKTDYHYEARTLAAISFSLWRAVFLADRSTKVEVKNAKAKEFIGKILVDNSIGFAQDRSSRDWTFVYYLDNAQFRIDDLLLRRKDDTDTWPPKGQRTARLRWNLLQKLFDAEVEWLNKKLKGMGVK